MADESGTPEDPVAPPPSSAGAGEGAARSRAALLDALARAPGQFDFFQALRRLDAPAGGGSRQPRFGAAWRPADEAIRLGQEPDLTFAGSSLANLRAGDDGAPPRLAVNFFGLLGPNGPLPLHLTEYARDRLRNADDPTMSRFLDLFHHRMLLFFYRAWAAGQPTVSRDRPREDRFEHYIGALPGIALAAVRSKDAFPHTARLYLRRPAVVTQSKRRGAGGHGTGLLRHAGSGRGVRRWVDRPAPRAPLEARRPAGVGSARGCRRSWGPAPGRASRSSRWCSGRSPAPSSSGCCPEAPASPSSSLSFAATSATSWSGI